jgi:hypothetical protein
MKQPPYDTGMDFSGQMATNCGIPLDKPEGSAQYATALLLLGLSLSWLDGLGYGMQDAG